MTGYTKLYKKLYGAHGGKQVITILSEGDEL